MLYQGIQTGCATAVEAPRESLYWKESSKLWHEQAELNKECDLERRFRDTYERINRLERLLEKAYNYIEELQAK